MGARVDGLAGAAGVLDGQRLEMVALGDAIDVLQPGDLEHFASQAHQQDGGEIRVAGIAPLRARQQVIAFALGCHAAALAVGQGDDAVDMGVVVQHPRPHGLVGDVIDHGRRTVHRRQDADVIARPHPPVGAAETREMGRNLALVQAFGRAGLGGEGVVAFEIGSHGNVLFVDPIARRDVGAGKADDLAELADGRALRDGPCRDLVAARDAAGGADAPFDRGSGRQVCNRHDNVVGVVQSQDMRFVHGSPPARCLIKDRPAKRSTADQPWGVIALR